MVIQEVVCSIPLPRQGRVVQVAVQEPDGYRKVDIPETGGVGVFLYLLSGGSNEKGALPRWRVSLIAVAADVIMSYIDPFDGRECNVCDPG